MQWYFLDTSRDKEWPNVSFSCEAADITEADEKFKEATGIDPCKTPKGASTIVRGQINWCHGDYRARIEQAILAVERRSK